MEQIKVRIEGREDLLGYVPYALGFHPADSIVLLGLAGRKRRIAMTTRADADQPTREITRDFCRAMKRARHVDSVILIGYGPDSLDGPIRTVAHDLRARCYLVHEVLRVSDGLFHCLDCDGCTAPAGRPFDIDKSAAAAAMTYAGMMARPSRRDVERLVRPIGGLAAVSMTQAVERAERRLSGVRDNAELVDLGTRAVDDAVARARDHQRLTDDEVAWLSVLMTDRAVRDHAWSLTGGQDWLLELWLDMTRRAEPILAAPMACLLSWCAWRGGNGGPIAISAFERAMRIDPDYDLLAILSEVLLGLYPPEVINQWPPPLSAGTGER